MPGTIQRPLVAEFEHQPRERSVPCQACRVETTNDHAVCDLCLDKGRPIRCSVFCRDIARAGAAR